MNTDSTDVLSSKAYSTVRTPDDIAFELTTYRDNIRLSLQSHINSAANGQARDEKHELIYPFILRILDKTQHYVNNFMRAKVTPSALINFGMKRPLATSVIAGAVVGAVVVLGPTRLLSWGTKAFAIWRIATTVRNR